MSEPFRCFQCGGHGRVFRDDEDLGDRGEECRRCKGSGFLALRSTGPGIPKSDDPYVAAPKGVNW